jgi:hypothetical protein
MKQRLLLIIAGFLVAVVATYPQNVQDTKSDKSAAPSAQSGNTTEDAQRLATGQITKIDVKKKTLTVREGPLNQPADNGQNTNANRRGGGMGGGGMGGGRRRGGVGFPGGGGGRPTSTAKPQGKEFKVIVTDQTAIKDNVTTIGFDLLRVGDRISIQGLPKGKGDDLQATQITVSQ